MFVKHGGPGCKPGIQNEAVDSETPKRCFAMSVLPRDATTKGPSSKQAALFFFQQVVIVVDSKTRTEVEHVAFKVVYRWMGAKSWFYMVLWSSHIDGTSFCSVPVLVCSVEAAKHENVLKISREQFTLTFLIVLKTR